MRRYGKTLLESIVVMAIIMILAGIALPVYMQALKKAQDTRDSMNDRNTHILNERPRSAPSDPNDPLSVLR